MYQPLAMVVMRDGPSSAKHGFDELVAPFSFGRGLEHWIHPLALHPHHPLFDLNPFAFRLIHSMLSNQVVIVTSGVFFPKSFDDGDGHVGILVVSSKVRL